MQGEKRRNNFLTRSDIVWGDILSYEAVPTFWLEFLINWVPFWQLAKSCFKTLCKLYFHTMTQKLWALLIEKWSWCVWIWVLSTGRHTLGYAFTEDDQNKDAESENEVLNVLRLEKRRMKKKSESCLQKDEAQLQWGKTTIICGNYTNYSILILGGNFLLIKIPKY